MRRLLAHALTMSAVVALTGCQAGGSSVSLEEAKQITARFSGNFTPPPKTINDLLAKIPEHAFQSGTCTYAAPMSDEEFRSMMSSLEPPRDGHPGRVGFAEDQADSEFELGRFANSVKYMKAALDEVPPELR